MSGSSGQRVRCAVYTRKSSEEGLEQDFNSLDAQREACSAYILSQASEGWVATGGIYDDGGLSGGTLERPALKRLLADVAAGSIDIIVVYKVDRLTRSLLDFSRLVEAFDAAGTSFVSVTQSFNTTTSMGRLTLNMLLSFAQFEREVTAERIRDKIAASKARGMWMGGTPPVGYKPDGRSLAVVEEHAATVREIFTRYLELGNVRNVADALTRDGILSPARSTATGKKIGGVPFSRGQLYLILRNRMFLGQIEHKGSVYPGLHPAILERDIWDRAQLLLAANLQGKRTGSYHRNPSLLAGILTDAAGEDLLPVHASKGQARYRYYVSRALQVGGGTGITGSAGSSGSRVPARELEAAVCGSLAQLFDDPLELLGYAWLHVPADCYAEAVARVQALRARIAAREHGLVRELLARVELTAAGVVLRVSIRAVAEALQVSTTSDAPEALQLTSGVRLTRSGSAMRLIHASGARATADPERSLTRLLAQAHGYWRELRKGELDARTLAAREQVSPSWVTRVLRLAFLSPEVTTAVLKGAQRGSVEAGTLVATDAVDARWDVQRKVYLPG